MSKSLSLYLDLIRFLAALAVFVSHLASRPFTEETVNWRFARYGDIAVTVFFILSGYVIAFVVTHREKRAGDYFDARLSRLYSVVLVALPLTLLCDGIGSSLDPQFYAIQKVWWKPPSVEGYLSSALLVNEWQVFRFNGVSPGSNAPWWSLSFEATYYLVAGLALFCRRWIWMPVVAVILACAGKTVAALLPLWLLGFMLYRVRQLLLPRRPALVLAALGAAGVLAMPLVLSHLPSLDEHLWLPWGRAPFNRNLVEDYVVAACFALHLFAAGSVFNGKDATEARWTRSLRWLGSLTFPLYLLHMPLICLLSVATVFSRNSPAQIAYVSTLTFLIVALLSPLCDRLKQRMRQGLQSVRAQATAARRLR